MIGRNPTPIDDEFLDAIVAVARAHRLPSLDDVERLAPHVEALTRGYNDPRLAGVAGQDHLAARLSFWLPRDIPKVQGAVRESVAIGRLGLTADTPLRVLDLGAGLGASHRGLARALAAAGMAGTLDVTAVDVDERALDLLDALHRARPAEGDVAITLRTAVGSAHEPPREIAREMTRVGYDVVLLGQVLTELDLDLTDDARIEAHAALVKRCLHATHRRTGVVVIVEPALRPRARHLQRVRDLLLAEPTTATTRPPTILAPCLHADRCPLLVRETDWCHDDLDVDLPPRLVAIAKRAGLRWEGLTFSTLILGNAGPSLRASIDGLVSPSTVAVRLVSAPMPTKGKRELIVCGDVVHGDAVAPAATYGTPHGARVGRLDREASDGNEAFAEAVRGDILTIAAPLDEKLRVGRATSVRRLDVAAVDATTIPSPLQP